MDEIQCRLANIIRSKRQEMKESQEQLANSIGKTPSFIGQVERQESLPSLETLGALIQRLGIDANDIFSTSPALDDTCKEICAVMRQMDDRKRQFLLELARLLIKSNL